MTSELAKDHWRGNNRGADKAHSSARGAVESKESALPSKPLFCYIIHCHESRETVSRLVRKVAALTPDSFIIVRFDRDGFMNYSDVTGVDNVLLFRSDIKIEWGTWSMVEAQIESLETAKILCNPDYTVIISGRDYPIVDLSKWEADVHTLGADALLHLHRADSSVYEYNWKVLKLPLLQGHIWHKVAAALTWRMRWFCSKWVRIHPSPRNTMLWVLGIKRQFNPGHVVLKASSWLTISRRAVAEIKSSWFGEPSDKIFYQTTRNPDEIYIPSVLAAKPALQVLDRITSYDGLRFGLSSPPDLNKELIAEARGTSAAFARKVPINISVELLAELNKLSETTS